MSRRDPSIWPLACILGVLLLGWAPRVEASNRGRPTVVLERLDFPKDVPAGRQHEQTLRKVLAKEVRRVEWGAGRNNRIEYRFRVTQLDVTVQDEVLRVSCAAVGHLPGGRSAKSQLSFGGDPKKRNQVIARVLEIVARGVVTRLAELERVRRGDLDRASARRHDSPALLW